jgi:hypothetical protein
MTEQKLPKATQNEFTKRSSYEEMAKNGNLSWDDESDYLELMNAYDWSAEIFSENGRYGIKSATGVVLVPAEYDEFICPMRHVEVLKIVVAAKSGKYGMVRADGSGMEITEFIYDYMAPWFGPVTAARIANQWNYITHEGIMLMPFNADKIVFDISDITFQNGISVFMNDGLYGVTDGYGFSYPVFDDLYMIEPDQFVTGTRNGVKGYISQQGEFTTVEEDAWWSAAD